MKILFKNIVWHDGNIISLISVFPMTKRDKSKVIINVDVYPSVQAAKRRKIQVEFLDVKKIIKNIDYEVIKDNVWAGSINNVKQKEIVISNKRYYEYSFILFGGLIKIVAKKSFTILA